eukprot:ctg_3361.g478
MLQAGVGSERLAADLTVVVAVPLVHGAHVHRHSALLGEAR